MIRCRMDSRGTTALEFAFLAPVLFLIVAAVIEVGAQATVAAALDFGARRASRMGITGSVDGTGTVASDQARAEAVRNRVLSSTRGILTDAHLSISQSSYGTIGDVAAGKSTSALPGEGRQLVRYELSYIQPLVTGFLSSPLFTQTHFTHNSMILVKNEPFPTK